MKKTLLATAVLSALFMPAALAQDAGTTPQVTPPLVTPADPTMPSAPGDATGTTAAPGAAANTATEAPSPTVASMTVDAQAPNQLLSSKLVGADVYSASGDKIGSVSDLLIDRDGKVAGVVVGVGGFLGVGAKDVGLHYNSITIVRDNNGADKLTVAVTKDDLLKAAAFAPSENG